MDHLPVFPNGQTTPVMLTFRPSSSFVVAAASTRQPAPRPARGPTVLRLRPEPDAEREEACQQWLVSAPGWKRDESEGENVTYLKEEKSEQLLCYTEVMTKPIRRSERHARTKTPARKISEKVEQKADSRLMQARGEKRSGSDSDAHSGRKRSRLHEDHTEENAPLYDAQPGADFSHDLTAHDRTGENHGENQTLLPGALSADELKSMHTILADLTDDELKNITILPAGTRLEQGEFVATSQMVADEGNAYVPKKETDYLLWNRLNQVEAPARLDETSGE